MFNSRFNWIKIFRSPWSWGFVSLGLILPLNRAIDSYLVLMKSYSEFKLSSFLNIIFNFLNVSLSIFFTILWGLYGLFFAAILYRVCFLIIIIFFLRNDERFQLSFKVEWTNFNRLFKIGLGLVLFSISFLVLKSIDNLLVGNLLGTKELGLYSIASLTNIFIYTTPNTLSAIIYPQLLERFGETGKVTTLTEFLVKPPIVFAYILLPILIGGTYFLIEPIIFHLLPNFISSIRLVKIILLGTFFISLTHIPNQFLIAIKEHKIIIRLVFITICTLIPFDIFLTKMGYGINIVVFSFAFFYFLITFFLFFESFRKLFNISKSIASTILYFIPVLYFYPILWLLNLLIPYSRIKLYDDLEVSLIKICIYFIMIMPLIFYGLFKSNLLMMLKTNKNIFKWRRKKQL